MKKLRALVCVNLIMGLAACGGSELPLCDEQDVVDLMDEIVRDEAKSQLFNMMLKKAGKEGEITFEKAVELKGRSDVLDQAVEQVEQMVEAKNIEFYDFEKKSENKDKEKVWCKAVMKGDGGEGTPVDYTAYYEDDTLWVSVDLD